MRSLRRRARVEHVGPGEAIEVLRALPLFADVPEDALQLLVRNAERRIFETGRSVIREGRVPSFLYVIESGTLEVLSTGEVGTLRAVNTLEPGEHLGEVGILEGMPSTATVVATADARLLRIPASDLLRAAREHSTITERIRAAAAERLQRTHPSYVSSIGSPSEAQDLRQALQQIAELVESEPQDSAVRSDALRRVREIARAALEKR